MGGGRRRSAVPDALLGPLLDAAGQVLRGLEPSEVPSALRALATFDPRGLANAAARHQLRRALDGDDEFRARVVGVFAARPDVQEVLHGWEAERAVDLAAAAADRGGLELWVSALYAAAPASADFGLGAGCAEDRHRRSDRALHEEARAASAELGVAQEARRRAERELAAVRTDLARLDADLREERRGRRDREAAAKRRSDDAVRARHEAEAALERVRRDLELAEARAHREAERARSAEQRLREGSREAGSGTAAPAAPATAAVSSPDRAVLADVARRARDVAATLERLERAAAGGVRREPTPREPPGPAPARAGRRRVALACPPGMLAEEPEAIEAMLRTPRVVLVVDGYNVSMAAWPAMPVDQQRDRLVSALARLHLRLRCTAIVVFDGSDVEGVRPRRTPGVRVVFSPAGEPADPLIVREAGELPEDVPVMVASSDREVRDGAAAGGATVVSADALLSVLRR